MNYTSIFRAGLLAACLLFAVRPAAGEQQPLYFRNGEVSFVLQDHLKHPSFFWPVTLLHYQVHFDAPVKQEELTLTQDGKPIPFQFSDQQKAGDGGQLVTLSFLSDLPSGGIRNFRLKAGKAPQPFAPVGITEEGASLLITTNKLAVRIPASQRVTGIAPGPVMQVFQVQGEAMGESVFDPGERHLERIETERIASGPVFTEYRVSYFFKDGARYEASVKAIRDYEFVELEETCSGIKKEENISWKINWKGFHPTHRQAPNHPYGGPGPAPGFARFDWERIDQTMLSYHHGVMPPPEEAGKIPFEVGLYDAWPAEGTVTSSLFWDEQAHQSIGAFITDAAAWNDKDYPIWHYPGTLSTRFYN